MGRPILKRPHSCGSRSGLQVFEEDDGKITGYCFSCGTFVAAPLGKDATIEDLDIPPPKSPEEIQARIAEIGGYQCLDIPQKKLRASSLDEFSIKVGVSEEDGVTPEVLYYPYRKKGKLTGYKVKLLPKDGKDKIIWSIGDVKNNDDGDVEPFGWQEALAQGARKVIIVEGEDDAVAAKQIIHRHTKDEWKDHIPAVISLPHGAGTAHETLAKWKKQLTQNWKEIVLCFDTDKAGQEAVQKCMIVLPDATSVTLPAKDANQCILDGVQKAAFNAMTFNDEKPKNSRLVFGEELHDVAREEAQYGELSWPYEHLNEVTRGIRYGETIYIGAG